MINVQEIYKMKILLSYPSGIGLKLRIDKYINLEKLGINIKILNFGMYVEESNIFIRTTELARTIYFYI